MGCIPFSQINTDLCMQEALGCRLSSSPHLSEQEESDCWNFSTKTLGSRRYENKGQQLHRSIGCVNAKNNAVSIFNRLLESDKRCYYSCIKHEKRSILKRQYTPYKGYNYKTCLFVIRICQMPFNLPIMTLLNHLSIRMHTPQNVVNTEVGHQDAKKRQQHKEMIFLRFP